MNDEIPVINKEYLVTEGVAGAGKTTTAIRNAKEALEKNPENGNKIMAVTLTKAAANEFSKRTDGALPGYTAHNIALGILRTEARLKKEKVPQIIDTDAANQMMTAIIAKEAPKCDPELLMKDINKLRTLGTPEDKVAPEAAMVLEDYRDQLRKKKQVDFTAILEEALELLKKPEIYSRYDGTILLSDETQDTNPNLEWQIIDILRKRSSVFMMYASPSQEIYAFRGANYSKVCETIPDYANKKQLLTSFRCPPEVVEVAKHLAGEDANQMSSSMPSSGFPVRWYEVANMSQETRLILEKIEKAKESDPNMKYNEVGILCHDSSELPVLEKTLNMYGYPAKKVGSAGNKYKQECVRRWADYLSIAINPKDDSVLDNIVNYPYQGLTETMLFPVHGIRRLSWNDIEKVVKEPEKFTPQMVDRANALLKYREAAYQIATTKDMSVQDKVIHISNESGILFGLTSKTGAISEAKTLMDINNEAQQYGTINEFYKYLLEKSQEDNKESNCIELCTYHSSKGREWNHVFLCESGRTMRTNLMSDHDKLVARNLAYVATTRAKKQLVIVTKEQDPVPFYLDFYLGNRRIWNGRN